jgi:hypothetical protein
MNKIIPLFVRCPLPLLCSGDMSDTLLQFFGSSFDVGNCRVISGLDLVFVSSWLWIQFLKDTYIHSRNMKVSWIFVLPTETNRQRKNKLHHE